MNSLLQQFYMIPDFREKILEIENENGSSLVKNEKNNVGSKSLNSTLDESLLYQFQLILCALKKSQKQFYDPRDFCFANKDSEGKGINVMEQMDVDEFFNNFLDKLENEIKVTLSIILYIFLSRIINKSNEFF